MTLRVYTASKLAKYDLWKRLASEWPGIDLHARWYSQVEQGVEETPENAARFWVEDEMDVRTADAVLVYGDGDDHLQGALVEAGMGIALGTPVIVVGNYNYGNWVYHPSVIRVSDLDGAKAYLDFWLTGAAKSSSS